ncbi:MAG TPA: hypothetical protein VFR55_03050 [Dehalococcoidia bacterium]|nr:hypothetical protein [Dehalococcoidia bacterium]
MTEGLEGAFAEAAKLPAEDQDAIAAWLMEELASEDRWSRAFAATSDSLKALAEEALAERRAGRSQALDPDEA